MLDLKHFQEAKKRVDEVIIPTPLIYSEAFSKECKNQVYIKPENLQRTGAFKIRGAYNKIMKMDDESKSKGLIASSAGNHAQGVAYAASKLGVKAVIVMPKHTPLIKVEATEAHGAEVVLAGEVYDEAYQKACDLQKEYGTQGYPQAAMFVKEGYQNDELFQAIQDFTENNYPDLKEKLESIGIDQLGLPSVDITVASIERQNVHYVEAHQCEDEIKQFLELFNITYSSDMLVS